MEWRALWIRNTDHKKRISKKARGFIRNVGMEKNEENQLDRTLLQMKKCWQGLEKKEICYAQ